MSQENNTQTEALLEWFFPKVIEAVSRRFQVNAERTILDVYQLNPAFTSLDPETVAFGFQNRKQLLQVFQDPAAQATLLCFFVNTTLEFTFQNNQFIQVNEEDERQLYQVYRAYLQNMQTVLVTSLTPAQYKANLEAVVREHFQALRNNIERYFDPSTGANVHSNVILQQVVCAEYSPALQLEILNIQLDQLLPPVLDLGCGKAGTLVKFLNAHGIEAMGVDRMVDPSVQLVQGDWLRFPLEPETWGTVISHMAFSNHFLFHHLYKSGEPYRYARQYMAILEALKPGGSFYYAPGLPFMEKLLPPDLFIATRNTVSPPSGMATSGSGISVSSIQKLPSTRSI